MVQPPTSHPIEKENHLNHTSMTLGSMLVFGGSFPEGKHIFPHGKVWEFHLVECFFVGDSCLEICWKVDGNPQSIFIVFFGWGGFLFFKTCSILDVKEAGGT